MIGSIARLLAIAAGVVILTVFALVFVHQMGLRQEFSAPPHPWFQKPDWAIVAPPLDTICQDAPAFPGEIVMVEVQKRPEGWVVPCTLSRHLIEILERSEQKDWLLYLPPAHANRRGAPTDDPPDLDKLVDNLRNFDRTMRFGVWAPAQNVARDLRKRAPQWVFAADSASLLRLHLFTSLFISTATEFWPDFVIASDNASDGTRLIASEVDELHRRKKRVIWNAIASPGQRPAFVPDGTLTSRP